MLVGPIPVLDAVNGVPTNPGRLTKVRPNLVSATETLAPMLLQPVEVDLGHDGVEHDLLMAGDLGPDLALHVIALTVPHHQRGKSRLMADNHQLMVAQDLDVGDPGVGHRNPADGPAEIVNL